MPIKILHILPNNEKRFFLFENLVKGLARKNFRQTICYLYGDSTITTPLDDNFPIVRIRTKKTKNFNPRIVFRISEIIRERGIDIVHCQRHKATVYGSLGAWAAGTNVKAITTVHGRNRTRNAGRKFVNHFVFKCVSKIVSVSDAVRQDIIETNPGVNPGKVLTVYNGIDVDVFSAERIRRESARRRIGIEEKGGVVFGTVGRLAPVKGQEFLLKAFSRVLKKFPDSHLVFAGAGSLENELKSRVENSIAKNRVRFLGHRKDIPEVLAALDCFVLPSLSEGHPLSLLEAMACERPVIASAVGGVPEILSPPDLGILTTPASTESLACAMEKVAGMDEGKRAMIGKNLRNLVLEKYTIQKVVSNTAEIYRSVIAPNTAGIEDR